MRRRWMCVPMMLLALVLSACGGTGAGSRAEQLALDMRGAYLAMTACTASMEVTADYGSRVYDYGIDVSWEKEGDTVLTVTAPENIAGVTARLRRDAAALEYDLSLIHISAWRRKTRRSCCTSSAGTRKGRPGRGRSAPCGLRRTPSPCCGGRSRRTASP